MIMVFGLVAALEYVRPAATLFPVFLEITETVASTKACPCRAPIFSSPDEKLWDKEIVAPLTSTWFSKRNKGRSSTSTEASSTS